MKVSPRCFIEFNTEWGILNNHTILRVGTCGWGWGVDQLRK
ncbi:hypothetical protein J3R74_002643 [Puniceicoccus vermicola]